MLKVLLDVVLNGLKTDDYFSEVLFRPLIFTISILSIQFTFSQSKEEINYTFKDGLPSNLVYCVIQDQQGYVWFGTDAGLSRFDGVSFKNYNLKDGLPDMEILNFYEDSHGRIWLYTLNGKVGYLKDGRIHNSENQPFLKNADGKSRLTSISVVNDLVFISFLRDGTMILDGTGVIKQPPNIKDRSYHWVTAFDSTYYLLKVGGHSLKVVPYATDKIDSVNGLQFTNFDVAQQIGHLINYKNQVFGFTNEKTHRQVLFKINLSTGKSMSRRFLTGTIYNIKSANDEIQIFTDTGIKVLDTVLLELEDKVSAFESTGFIKDIEGNYWITTLSNGVLFRAIGKVKQFKGENLKEVQSLYSYKDSLLYVAYEAGKLGSISCDDEFEAFQDTGDSSPTRAIYRDTLNQIWTYHFTGLKKNTAYLPERHTFNKGYFKDGKAIFEDGGSFFYWDVIDQSKSQINSDQLGRIQDIDFLDENLILIASARGLSILDTRQMDWKFLKGFERMGVTEIEIDKFGSIWLATNGYGLIRLTKSSLLNSSKELTIKNQINDYSEVYEILLLKDSIAYAKTPSGIAKIHFDETKILDYHQVNYTNGLGAARIYDIEYFQGRIYVAQENGLFSFSTSENFHDNADFPLLIEDLVTADSLYSPSEMLIFPSDVGSIQINCKAIIFKNQDNLRYEFRLVKDTSDLSQQWNRSENSQFIFSNLPSGRYSFQVRAKTVNSDWTNAQVQHFEIATIYWQTWWFRLLAFVLIVSCMVIGYYLYTASKRRREVLVRKKIESDLKALKAQINPHFLFNSINSIQSYILEGDNELAEEYLLKYSKLIRMILNHSNVLTVFVCDEIEALKTYVELEKIRLSKPFDFIVDTGNVDVNEEKVPSMVIQPLIENAIWHGIQSVDRLGKILLSFARKEDKIVVTLEDNGKGFDMNVADTRQEPHGVRLVKERIELINKHQRYNSTFEMVSSSQGTRVIFTYPSELVEI